MTSGHTQLTLSLTNIKAILLQIELCRATDWHARLLRDVLSA